MQELVASLCRTSVHQHACTALASSTATSGAKAPGQHDNLPVLPQHAGEGTLCAFVERCFTLAVGGFHIHSSGTGYRFRRAGRNCLSPQGLPCQWVYHFTTECLLTSAGSIAHLLGRCKASPEGKMLRWELRDDTSTRVVMKG